jgi:multidrug resistance efflux pump
MIRNFFFTGLLCAIFAANLNFAVCQTPAPPETITLKAAPLYIVDSLDARVESKNATTIKIDAKVWSSFKVNEVAPQGKAVKKGDTLISFESKDIAARLQEMKYDFDLAKLDLDAAKADLDFLAEVGPIEKDLMERAWKNTQDDIKYYFDVQKPLAEKQAQRSFESSKYQVEYAQDELDQLQKMYNADQLTEESEKIVLKRAERSLDQTKFFSELSDIGTRRQLEVELPRTIKEKETGLEKGRLEYAKKSLELPRTIQKKELDYAKLKFAFEKKERDYNDLIRDAEFMKLAAPADGVVYHGQARRGTWTKGATTTSRMIEIGDAIAVGAPVITLVDLKNLQLRCDFDQKQKRNLQKGTQVIATFDDRPSERVEGTILEIGQFPLDDGKFDGVIQLASLPEGIVPGMTCKIKVVSYKNDKALLVPKTAVFSDDGGLSQYVYVWVGEKAAKRPIVALRESGDQLEVMQGLAEGDKVLKAKPQ